MKQLMYIKDSVSTLTGFFHLLHVRFQLHQNNAQIKHKKVCKSGPENYLHPLAQQNFLLPKQIFLLAPKIY